MLYYGFNVNGAGQVEHEVVLSAEELELLWSSIHARIARWEQHDEVAPKAMTGLEESLWEIIKPAEEGVTE